MQTFGLRTHIWNSFWRSALLLAGFPLLLAVTAYGVALIVGGDGGGVGAALARGLRMLPWYYMMAWGVALVWFGIALSAHDSILDWVTEAHPVTRKDEPRLWNLLENLAIARGMRMPRLAVIETAQRNAFAAGLSREQGSVTVTRGLIDALDDRELAAVLAHELTHIRNGDARLGLIAAVFVGVISLGFDLMGRRRDGDEGGGWSSFRWRSNSRDGGGLMALIGVVAILIAGALAALLRMALSRNREFLADAGAVEITQDPDAMIGALRKVEGAADMPAVPRQVRALFLEDSSDAALSGLMATHPPIAERIAALVRHAGGRDPGPRPAEAPPAEAAAAPWGRATPHETQWVPRE